MAGLDVQHALSAPHGMGGLSPEEFEPILMRLIEPYLPDSVVTPVLCCGMVGAKQGWSEAGYAAVPCTPMGAANPVRARATDPRIAVSILPGLCQADPPDVMRGEETQIAGYLAENPHFDGVICLPGTHSKWVQISAAEVVNFRTTMTGELFALISQRSVLRHSVGAEGWDAPAFDRSVAATLSRPAELSARLFRLRAADILHCERGARARAALSGLLIGAELAATRPYWLGQDVVILGDETLAALYARALCAQGLDPKIADAEQLTLVGLSAACRKFYAW